MIVRDINGDPSWLDSWLLWRKFSMMGGGVQSLFDRIGYQFPDPFWKFLMKYNAEVCPFCNGWGEINDPNHGRAYCLCMVLDWQAEADKNMKDFESYAEPRKLSELMVTSRMDPSQQQTFLDSIDYVDRWMRWPNRWLVLWGGQGTGKSTVLKAIKKDLPIARYVTAYDFEQQMYRGQGDGTFDRYLELLGQVPILLFDDWGAEYGKPLVHAKATAVIDRRDRVWRELLTVVATNLPMAEFKSYNQRMGSRLLDSDKVEVLSMNLPDYRVRKG
jgi:DNA replication protein DnaC